MPLGLARSYTNTYGQQPAQVDASLIIITALYFPGPPAGDLLLCT